MPGNVYRPTNMRYTTISLPVISWTYGNTLYQDPRGYQPFLRFPLYYRKPSYTAEMAPSSTLMPSGVMNRSRAHRSASRSNRRHSAPPSASSNDGDSQDDHPSEMYDSSEYAGAGDAEHPIQGGVTIDNDLRRRSIPSEIFEATCPGMSKWSLTRSLCRPHPMWSTTPPDMSGCPVCSPRWTFESYTFSVSRSLDEGRRELADGKPPWPPTF